MFTCGADPVEETVTSCVTVPTSSLKSGYELLPDGEHQTLLAPWELRSLASPSGPGNFRSAGQTRHSGPDRSLLIVRAKGRYLYR